MLNIYLRKTNQIIGLFYWNYPLLKLRLKMLVQSEFFFVYNKQYPLVAYVQVSLQFIYGRVRNYVHYVKSW